MIKRCFNEQRELNERAREKKGKKINGKLHSIYFNAFVLTATVEQRNVWCGMQSVKWELEIGEIDHYDADVGTYVHVQMLENFRSIFEPGDVWSWISFGNA